ncbi:MAG: SIMPL domain-containing protein [Clostridia bacterium]|nr:SIMPL domain-containing protein [Clostridia bacterium]
MKNQILKGAFAIGCLTLALFSVVKTEEGKKKPIIMKQMTAAEELVDEDLDRDVFVMPKIEHADTTLSSVEVDDEVELEEPAAEENDLQKIDVNQQTDEQAEATQEDSSVIEYEADEDISICVFGRARTSVSPDSAMIYARIETLDNDISISKENNFQTFEAVVAAITEKGLDKENVKLEFFGCQPSYDYSSGKTLNGYYSTTSFSICCVDVEDVSDYISLLTENGVTAIDNISYKVSDMEGQYNLALSQAIENARVKAEKMAGEGLNLVRLKEEYVCSTNNLMRTISETLAPTDYIGKVEIEAQVMAVFEK